MVHSGKFRLGIGRLVLGLLLGSTILLTSACGGDAQLELRTSTGKAQLDQLLQSAQQLGVPGVRLQLLLQQEQKLSATTAPLSLFDSQASKTYYTNLATRYARLAVQVRGIIVSSRDQARIQAERDLQKLQTSLQQADGLPTQGLTLQLTQEQKQLPTANTISGYVQISAKAQAALQSLSALHSTAGQIADFKQAIDLMQTEQLDVAAQQAFYEQDQKQLSVASGLPGIQQLSSLVGTQYQQATTVLESAIPTLTAQHLDGLNQQVKLILAAGLDSDSYQQKLITDQALVKPAMSIQEYQAFASKVDADTAAARNYWVNVKLVPLLQQFHREADAWGYSHMYYDDFNSTNYSLDAGYQLQGIGSELDAAVSEVATLQDANALLNEINNALFDLHMLEADYQDSTPYDQVHVTDQQILDHYQLHKGQVVLVSLSEQAMRVYQDGNLVRAFLVTTGRPELPSLPGLWSVQSRLSPTIFRSGEPRWSPYWYPNTPIHYAILYHAGGYFIHDSWWRANYGPGTQFPHADSAGNQSFAGNGSHGCINMREDQASWVYNNTGWNTSIVIY